MEGFNLVRQVIRGQVHAGDVDTSLLERDCQQRLIRCLQSPVPASADLAILIRHLLRQESELQAGNNQTLRVPRSTPWPGEKEWSSWGIHAEGHPSGDLVLRAESWQPGWLPHSEQQSIEASAFREADRRSMTPVPGDPFLENLGRQDYLCAGQHAAVRATLSAPPGSTLVVNLPTGSGKSLCSQLLGCLPLVYDRVGGATVVVVPTTALAIDQARAIRQYCGYDAVYRAGGGDEQLGRNREIWQRLRSGEGIVFTSPESLVGSLRPAVYEAARSGQLRALVIDEAHIVDQWGDGFRSEFQELAGLRRGLLDVSPGPRFRTILLSATLTRECVDTLETLFGEKDQFGMVSAVQLRPEPSYWLARCSEPDQVQRILEAIHHLPRPLILYTTEVESANEWGFRLRSAGYRRMAVMTGKTGSHERGGIVNRWSAGELDLVVGTSAFGLGIDQSHVRTVIHACLPETLDRYYQEVGRGGRDGKACISLMLYTDRDHGIAKRMNENLLISIERGLQRWQQMWRNKEAADERRWRVPIDIAPALAAEDINRSSDWNTQWNQRTLTLLCRAGILAMADEPPRIEPQNASQTSAAVPPAGKTRVVEVLDSYHLSPARWQEVVDPVRRQSWDARGRQWALLEEILAGDRCAGQILVDAYALPSRASDSVTAPRSRVSVYEGCGGCNFCRKNHIPPYGCEAPPSPYPWAPRCEVGPILASELRHGDVLAIFMPGDAGLLQAEDYQWILDWAVEQGVRCVEGNGLRVAGLRANSQSLRRRPVFLVRPEEVLHHRFLPGVLLRPGEKEIRMLLQRRVGHRAGAATPPLLVVLGEEDVDPDRPDRRMRDVLPYRGLRFRDFRTITG